MPIIPLTPTKLSDVVLFGSDLDLTHTITYNHDFHLIYYTERDRVRERDEIKETEKYIEIEREREREMNIKDTEKYIEIEREKERYEHKGE